MSSAFRVGDRVQVPLLRGKLQGVITEDRGAIGARGRRLYEVLVFRDPFEPTLHELPEDEIEPMDELAESGSGMEKRKIKAYLVHGGLIGILRSNLSGGRNQPRAWFRPDTLGNVTHTFDEQRGIVGGGVVPSMAVYGDKVFSPKREEVLSFLQSFHLDRAEAEKILSAVGTAP